MAGHMCIYSQFEGTPTMRWAGRVWLSWTNAIHNLIASSRFVQLGKITPNAQNTQ